MFECLCTYMIYYILFVACFLIWGLSFKCIKKRMTDLKSAGKIGLGTILKFCEITKKLFTTVLLQISKLGYKELSVFHEIGTIGLRIMSPSHLSC